MDWIYVNWISVNDRLPPIEEDLLFTGWDKYSGHIEPTIAFCRDHALDEKGRLQVFYFDGVYDYHDFMASHYMYLPRLPEAIFERWKNPDKILPPFGEVVLVMLENNTKLLAWYEEELKWCSNDYRITGQKIIKWAHLD